MAAPMDHKKLTYLIYLSGFLDLFGVSLIMPLILSHAQDLGATPTVAGILGSMYGAIQLVTSPLVGQWSDVAGRRFILLVCLLMTACGYTAFAMATTIAWMFVARIPLGIFKHSQNISKSYLVDISEDSEQAANIGNFNAASSMGFIIGPAVGGHIAEIDGGFYLVAVLAGIVFFINFIFIFFLVPSEGTTHKLRHSATASTSLRKLASDEINFSPKTFLQAAMDVNWKDLWDLYSIKFLLGACIIVFRSNFSLLLVRKFSTTPVVNGYIISVNGVVSALVGFITGHICKLYSSNAKLVLHLSILLSITMICLALSPSLWIFVLLLIPLCFVSTISRVASTALMLERGNKEEVGILMGFQQSCMSIARMVAPLVAGLSQEVTSSGPCIVGAVFTMSAVIIMMVRPQDPKLRKKKSD